MRAGDLDYRPPILVRIGSQAAFKCGRQYPDSRRKEHQVANPKTLNDWKKAVGRFEASGLTVGTDAGCPDSPPFVKNIWPGP